MPLWQGQAALQPSSSGFDQSLGFRAALALPAAGSAGPSAGRGRLACTPVAAGTSPPLPHTQRGEEGTELVPGSGAGPRPPPSSLHVGIGQRAVSGGLVGGPLPRMPQKTLQLRRLLRRQSRREGLRTHLMQRSQTAIRTTTRTAP